MQAADHFI